VRTRSFSIVPVGQSQSRLVLPRAMQGPPARTVTYQYQISQQGIDLQSDANSPGGAAPVEQAEVAYRRMTEGWSRRGRRAPTGAAKEERL
jgi:hypothetical protein